MPATIETLSVQFTPADLRALLLLIIFGGMSLMFGVASIIAFFQGAKFSRVKWFLSVCIFCGCIAGGVGITDAIGFFKETAIQQPQQSDVAIYNSDSR